MIDRAHSATDPVQTFFPTEALARRTPNLQSRFARASSIHLVPSNVHARHRKPPCIWTCIGRGTWHATCAVQWLTACIAPLAAASDDSGKRKVGRGAGPGVDVVMSTRRVRMRMEHALQGSTVCMQSTVLIAVREKDEAYVRNNGWGGILTREERENVARCRETQPSLLAPPTAPGKEIKGLPMSRLPAAASSSVLRRSADLSEESQKQTSQAKDVCCYVGATCTTPKSLRQSAAQACQMAPADSSDAQSPSLQDEAQNV
nr:hypothetical protein CFP56_42096 [Quercus suber]